MQLQKEWKPLTIITAVFLFSSFLPVGTHRFNQSVLEALHLVKWYAREHVILCLIPAFFIAGAIAVFISKGTVMKYLGAGAKKITAYGVASVSGSILAVCSCTVLPLFAGIYRMGAGLGPAVAFLYSGPAINVLAVILTARVLGLELGIARAVGAIIFSIVIGLLMHLIYRKEELTKTAAQPVLPDEDAGRPLAHNALYFAALIFILVFANWGESTGTTGFWHGVYAVKWYLTGAASLLLGVLLVRWFNISLWKIACTGLLVLLAAQIAPETPIVPFVTGVIALSIILGTQTGEPAEWLSETWTFTKQILPLLFIGVLLAGFFLGRPGQEGIIPSRFISGLVGGNSLSANLFASAAGALMYFATLTEVPILQGLLGSGMGKGPALALLLAGPALSLPNMLVIRSILGTQKTLVFTGLVILMATLSGWIFGILTS